MYKIAFDNHPRALYHGALMAGKRAEPELLIEVPRLISAGATRSGQLLVRDLPRLLSAGLLDDGGTVDYELTFGRDEDGRQLVRGHLSTRVSMQCQRCLEPVAVSVEHDFALECVWSELQFPGIAKEHEPYLMVEEPVPLNDMIEDEVLLSLPLVARHEPAGNCEPPSTAGSESGTDTAQSASRQPHEGPLAAGLRQLKKKH